jgi:hypothetical protein
VSDSVQGLEMERAAVSNVPGPGPYPGQVRPMYICILQTTAFLDNFWLYPLKGPV